MIDQLDILLRKLITSTVPGLSSDDQVRFQPPDEDWRTYVKTLSVGGQPANALNVYLVDLRENRKLRTNERRRITTPDGDVDDAPAPRSVDCHYLISAWSPADTTPAIEPALDEHALLYAVATSLLQRDPLEPAAIYAPAPVPGTFPPDFAAAQLPLVLTPPEGFIKLAEFWGTMGEKHRWKPVLYLIVTVPLFLPVSRSGPMVTTALVETRATDAPSSAGTQIQIGGVARDAQAPPQPAPEVWIELLTMTNERLQLARTDADGRFTFIRVVPGAYQLRGSRTGLGVVTRTITVPSPTGEYDLQF